MLQHCWKLAALGWFALVGSQAAVGAEPSAEVKAALATILSVDAEGKNNPEVSKAWQTVTGAGLTALLPTLGSFQKASPVAANWLRTAVEAIVQGQQDKLPTDDLTQFLNDTRQSPVARRLAFELIKDVDSDTAAKLLPEMIDDPSLDIRRDAIEARIAKLDKITSGGARLEEYRKLFSAARDVDQVELMAEKLEKAGEKADITKHFGYLTEWSVVGPFDSTDGSGFDKPYPPEAGVDLDAKYEGKAGEVTWKHAQSHAQYGGVDLNEALNKHKYAAAYAYTVVVVDKETPIELRAASQNAVKMFLNGEQIFSREEYHHGTRMDQHTAKGVLKPGENQILVKVCQNDQDQAWAQKWEFALRICDATGGAVPLKQIIYKDGQPSNVEPGKLKPAPKKAKE